MGVATTYNDGMNFFQKIKTKNYQRELLKNYSPTQQIGIKAEKVACKFLKKQGLSLITRNFITPLGEIDLIMQDSESIVFIEVRSRQPGLVTAMETVNLPKQQKIIRSANIYLQKNSLCPCQTIMKP